MTTLALPPAGRDRPTHVFTTAALLAAAGGTTLFGALIGAYANVRHYAVVWPPKGVKVDMYLGGVLTITLLISAWLVEWAPAALRRSQPRQVMGALALTVFLGVAFINGLWYFVTRLHLPVKATTYAELSYALVGASGVAAAGGIVALLAVIAKVSGRQVGPRDPDLVRAAAWYWQFVVVSWVAVYSTLFLLK